MQKPWPDLMQAPGWLPGRQRPCRRCSVQIRASARAACAALPQCCGAGRAARARARRARTASCSAAAQRAASASDSKASVTTSLPRRRRASSLYSVKENCAPRARPRCQLPSRARCAALRARRARRAKARAGAPITRARRRAPGAGALQLGVLRPGRGCWAREQARGRAGRAHQLPVLVRARHERQQRVVAARPQHAVAALPQPAQPVRLGQVPDLAQVRRAGRPARANPVPARVGQSVGLRPRQCCCSGSAPLVPLHALQSGAPSARWRFAGLHKEEHAASNCQAPGERAGRRTHTAAHSAALARRARACSPGTPAPPRAASPALSSLGSAPRGGHLERHH